MAGAISIRLAVDGAAEAKAALEGFRQNVSGLTDRVRSSLESLSSGDASGKLADQLSGAAAKVAAAQRQLSALPAGDTAALAAAQKQVAAATDVYTGALERRRAQLVPTAAAEQALAKSLADVASAEKLGALSTAEGAVARQQAQTTYDRQIQAIKAVDTGSDAAAKSIRGGQMALRDLALQGQDFFVQVASGGGFFRPLLQQGSQVAQQLQASGQGFGALRSAASIALGAVTSPMGLLVTGATLATGAVVALGVAAENEAVRLGNLREQLRATHDDYQALATSVDVAAKKIAATSTLSLGDARSAAQTIASAKYFTGTADDIVQLTKVSADLARVWNVDVTAAAGRARDAINDPAEAAKKFATEGMPAFNSALVTNVELLERAGKAGQAQKVVLDALRQGSAGAAQDQSTLSKALHDLSMTFTRAGEDGKSFATTIGSSIDSAAAAMVRLVDTAVQGLARINAAANIADTNARDLAKSQASAASNAAIAPDATGRSPLLGPVIPGSNERAVGLMQVLPSTGRSLGYDVTTFDQNIAAGLTYFSQNVTKRGSVDAALAQYGGYGTDVQGASGYIGKVQNQDVSKLPTDVAGQIDYWGQILGLPPELITIGKKIALTESGGRQYTTASSTPLPAIDVVAAAAERRDFTSSTSAANRALAADQRRLSDLLPQDSQGTRAVSSLGNAADLERTRSQLELVNRQVADLARNGDTRPCGRMRES